MNRGTVSIPAIRSRYFARFPSWLCNFSTINGTPQSPDTPDNSGAWLLVAKNQSGISRGRGQMKYRRGTGSRTVLRGVISRRAVKRLANRKSRNGLVNICLLLCTIRPDANSGNREPMRDDVPPFPRSSIIAHRIEREKKVPFYAVICRNRREGVFLRYIRE